MKELVPACPRCNTSKFVVRDRIAEKAGTIVGGAVGAGSAYAGLSSGAAAGAAIGSFIPILGTAAGAGIGALTGTLLGFLAGSATGQRGWRKDRCEYPHEIPLYALRQRDPGLTP